MRRGKGHRATDSGVSDAENSMAASGSNKTVREGVSSRMSDCVIDFFDLEIWLCAPSRRTHRYVPVHLLSTGDAG